MAKLVCELVLPYCDPQDTIVLSRTSHHWRATVRNVYLLGALLGELIRVVAADGYKQTKLYQIVSYIAHTAAARRYVGAIDPDFYDVLTYTINRGLPPQKIFPVMILMSPVAQCMLIAEDYRLECRRDYLTLRIDGAHTLIACEFYDGCGLCELNNPWYIDAKRVSDNRKSSDNARIYLYDNTTVHVDTDRTQIKLRRRIKHEWLISLSTMITIVSFLIALAILVCLDVINCPYLSVEVMTLMLVSVLTFFTAINADSGLKPPRPQTYVFSS